MGRIARWSFSAIVLTLGAVITAVSCVNPLTAKIKQDEYSAAGFLNAPVSEVPSGRSVTSWESLTFFFEEPIDIGTLNLGGSLASHYQTIQNPMEADQITVVPNPTLWPTGLQDLTISCESESGKVLNDASYSWTVFEGICVDDGADPGDADGSVAHPYTTIQEGIDAVDTYYGTGTVIPVRLAVGTYGEDCDYGTAWVAEMQPWVSLAGGYRSDFTGPASSGATMLSNTADSDDIFANPASVIYCDASGTSSQTIEDVEIDPGGSALSTGAHAGIHVDGGSPTIRNVTIEGASTSGPEYVQAMRIDGGSPSIENPDFDPGHAQAISFGLSVYGGSLTVSGTDFAQHRILAGTGGTHAISIFLSSGCTGSISGIRIEGPTSLPLPIGSIEYQIRGGCIEMYDNGVSITGNQFDMYPTTQLYAVYEFFPGSGPSAFTDNDFAIPNTGSSYWYRDHDENVVVSSVNYDSTDITNGGTTGKLMDPAGFDNYSSTFGINE